MNEKPTIEVGKVPIITKFIYTLGALPTSYLMSMTYLEQVTWLCNYIQTTLIPQINEDVEAIQELQNLYELLRTYVNNYFNNLDVQEEINNKLDEMLEDGTLQHLIASYLDIQKIYNTTEEMIADGENLVDGLNVQTLGYSALNDGGGAFYQITDTVSSNLYQINLGPGLYASLIEKEADIKVFGVSNDDDVTSLLNNIKNKLRTIYFNNLDLVISDDIIISNPINLIFKNSSLTSENSEKANYISLLHDSLIDGLVSTNVGIDVFGNNNLIKNCKLNNTLTTSFYINPGNSVTHIGNKFENCHSYKSKAFGFYVGRNFNISRGESIANAIVDDLIYENCSALYNGQDERTTFGEWTTGFCLEDNGAINNKIMYINCEAGYSVESGFHCEIESIPKDLTLINCYSHDNGMLKAKATYGSGYLLPTTAKCVNCISRNNSKMFSSSDINLSYPLNNFDNLDIYDDSNKPKIINLKDLFGKGIAGLNWAGDNIIPSNVVITNTSQTPKLRPEYYFGKSSENDLATFVTITDRLLSFGNTNVNKMVDLNIIPITSIKNLNVSVFAKAKVETTGVNNNCAIFLMGYDKQLNATGIVTSFFLNGITTEDFTEIKKENVTISNKNTCYVVPVINVNYSTSYTYQQPDIKDITIYQN